MTKKPYEIQVGDGNHTRYIDFEHGCDAALYVVGWSYEAEGEVLSIQWKHGDEELVLCDWPSHTPVAPEEVAAEMGAWLMKYAKLSPADYPKVADMIAAAGDAADALNADATKRFYVAVNTLPDC